MTKGCAAATVANPGRSAAECGPAATELLRPIARTLAIDFSRPRRRMRDSSAPPKERARAGRSCLTGKGLPNGLAAPGCRVSPARFSCRQAAEKLSGRSISVATYPIIEEVIESNLHHLNIRVTR